MRTLNRAKKVITIMLALALVFTLTPAIPGAVENAYAAGPDITINADTENTGGTSWRYDKTSKTLTLDGYSGGCINLETSVTVELKGTNTITVSESSGDDAYGIKGRGSSGLIIDGAGSLTIDVSHTTRSAYGIKNELGVLTMSGGTVNITASSTSSKVYGVYGDAGVALDDGSLTVGVSGKSDGYGLYCKAGKLTVGSGAGVNVTVTNNGSETMYGIYNEASDGGVTDNGDIALAGTVTVTRGSGTVYGIANNRTDSNTDGVISITGGSVTVTNADYGIVAFTKGHNPAFADVVISDGTVGIDSTLSGRDSLGIVSWNNGVTISGGTVTASTANKALWLADSANKTGLVEITGDAVVSLTSTNYKALVVQEDESNASTRVHKINLTSGGRVTVKSTSESYCAFPVQGYFSLGSSTKITEGSFRAVDGTNVGGGKLFQADSITKQVVVEYSTPAPDANSVSVNGHPFAALTKLYYKNGDSDTGNGSTDYNAHYDPATGVLELKNYNSGPIMIGGSVESDITIKLVGNNVINSNSQFGIVNNNGGDITITAGSDATLIINVTNDSNYAYGIACDIPDTHTSCSRAITISGKANVTVNATATSTVYNMNAVGIFTPGTVAIKDNASFKAVCKSSTPSTGLQSAAGIYGYSGVTINTTGKVDIDTSQCSGAYNYGIYGNPEKSYNRLEKVSYMTIKWKNGSSGAPVTPPTSFDSAAATHAINVDTTNCVATYRYGTPYTVTVNNGSCDAANRQYLEDDTVNVTADTISGLTFKKWTSADVTVADSTNETTTFTMPDKDVTVTANYNLFTTEPSFTRISDTQGTISFTLAAETSSAPKLVKKDSDTVVGNQYFSGSTLERSRTVTNTGTYAVPNGEYRIAVQYGAVWFYSDVFTVDYTAVTGPSAKVGDVTITGEKYSPISDKEVTITLTNDKFYAIEADTVVSSWFTNLPNGLKAKVNTAVNANDTTATITISGTPTVVSDAVMHIKLPAANLVSSADLTVTANANAKFNIAKSAQTPTANNVTATFGDTGKSVTITGLNESPTVSYAVQSGNDVVDVNASTGALTIKKAGSETVRISYEETTNYAAGHEDVTVTVNKKSPTTIAITGVDASYDYTGSAIEPVLATVTADDTAMALSDYQVTYGANKNAGASAGSITIKAKDTGNYTFTDYTKNFGIAPVAASTNINATVQATQNTVFGTGDFTQPTFKGLNNETVTGNVTYTISDTSNGATTVSDGDYNAAKASLATLAKDKSVGVSWTFTPTGTTATNYSGTKTGDITITAKQSGGSGGGGGGGGGGGAAPTTPAQKPEIKPVTGGKVSLSADGTTATITPDAGKVVDKVLVNGKDMGAVTELKGLKTGDKIEVLFKDEVKEPGKAETDKQVKAHMQKLAPKARSLKTKAGNVKVSFEGQFKDIEALGYTVKYKFYRSTKKASGYKYRLTTSKPSYTNTGGKKGTLYYYKAIALAYDKDGKLIAKTELKQCRYACRRWSK